MYELRAVATNGRWTRSLLWVKARLGRDEIQCGVSAPGYRHHASFHGSGEIRIGREPAKDPAVLEGPAVAQVGQHRPSPALHQLERAQWLASFALPFDDESLGEFPVYRARKRVESLVCLHTRAFQGDAVGADIWVAPRNDFFQPLPRPPGFRHISRLSDRLWLVVDIMHSGSVE